MSWRSVWGLELQAIFWSLIQLIRALPQPDSLDCSFVGEQKVSAGTSGLHKRTWHGGRGRGMGGPAAGFGQGSEDEFIVVRTKAPGAGAQVRESENSLGLVESSSSSWTCVAYFWKFLKFRQEGLSRDRRIPGGFLAGQPNWISDQQVQWELCCVSKNKDGEWLRKTPNLHLHMHVYTCVHTHQHVRTVHIHKGTCIISIHRLKRHQLGRIWGIRRKEVILHRQVTNARGDGVFVPCGLCSLILSESFSHQEGRHRTPEDTPELQTWHSF